jgi:tripeptidyl-peptidase-1
MMQVIRFTLIATLAILAEAVPTTSRYVVHEERASQGLDWVKRSRVEPSAVLPMRIGLTQTNLHKGYDLLMEVLVYTAELI